MIIFILKILLFSSGKGKIDPGPDFTEEVFINIIFAAGRKDNQSFVTFDFL